MDTKEQMSLLDLIARVYTLEKILVDKNLISKEDLAKEYSKTSEKIFESFVKFTQEKIGVTTTKEALNKLKSS